MASLTKTLPRVTACIPAYNSANFILATLEALKEQDYPNLGVLISDDASSDSTAQICNTFTDASEKFRLIRQQRRLGWVENVNALLAVAEGEYIFILPHDDIIYPTYVSRLVRALESCPDAILAYSDTTVSFWDNTQPDKKSVTAAYKELDGVEDKFERARRAANYQLDVCNQCWPDVLTIAFRGVFRRDACKKTGGLHKNIAGEFGADWAWLFHLALLGEWVRVPEILVEKRRFPDSLSRSWNYSDFQRFGEWTGCVLTVCRADMSWREEIKVYSYLAGAAVRTLLRIFTIRYLSVMGRLAQLIGAQ